MTKRTVGFGLLGALGLIGGGVLATIASLLPHAGVSDAPAFATGFYLAIAGVVTIFGGAMLLAGFAYPLMRRLRQQDRLLTTLLNDLPGVVFRGHHEDNCWMMEFISDGCLALTGYPPADFVERRIDFARLIHGVDRRRVWHEIKSAALDGRPFQSVFRIVTASGEYRWVLAQGRGQCTPRGNLLWLEGFLMDVSERQRAEQQARLLSSALEGSAEIVIITDQDGVIEYVNQAFVDATGYTRAEALGQQPRLLNSGRQEAPVYQQMWDTLLKGDVYRGVLVNRCKNGDLYYEEKTITPLKDAHGQITHFISLGKDISDRMEAHERLAYLAHHDVLTDLPNRALLIERITQAIATTRRTRRALALLFIDLDNFKTINDSLGHAAGDRALKTAARRLVHCVRAGDTVARLGGDEFVVVLTDMDDSSVVPVVARKIIGALARPIDIDGHEFAISASIGISRYPADGRDATTLLRNADIAMYRAKDLGRNNYQYYSTGANVGTGPRLLRRREETAVPTGVEAALTKSQTTPGQSRSPRK